MIAADLELSPLEWRREVRVWVLIYHSLGIVGSGIQLGSVQDLWGRLLPWSRYLNTSIVNFLENKVASSACLHIVGHD